MRSGSFFPPDGQDPAGVESPGCRLALANAELQTLQDSGLSTERTKGMVSLRLAAMEA